MGGGEAPSLDGGWSRVVAKWRRSGFPCREGIHERVGEFTYLTSPFFSRGSSRSVGFFGRDGIVGECQCHRVSGKGQAAGLCSLVGRNLVNGHLRLQFVF